MPIPKLVITAGLMAANMALTMTKKTEGPRLDDLKFTGGDYGSALPNIYGLRRVPLQVFWAEDLAEVRQTRKTKGGKFNDYTYYGTLALALAGHEVSGLRRLWGDKHLVLDLSGAGPVTPFQFVTDEGGKGTGGAGDGGFALGDHIAIYPGSETQDADPRMTATVEALHGAGSNPAYRGTAYAVIKDLPLEKFGNRIPQFDGEIASTTENNYPWDSGDTVVTDIANMIGAQFSPDYSRFMWASPNGFEIWDVAARTRMISGTFAETLAASYDTIGLFDSGAFLIATGIAGSTVTRYEADGGGGATYWTAGGASEYVSSIRVMKDAAGDEHWIGLTYSSNQTYVLDSVVYNLATLTSIANARATGAFLDEEGSIWLAGSRGVVSGTTALFYRILAASGATGPGLVTVTGLPAAPGVLQAVSCHAFGGNFVFSWGTQGLYIADNTGTVLYSNLTTGLDVYDVDAQINLAPRGASSIWFGDEEVSMTDLSVIRTVDFNDWTGSPSFGGAAIYDPTNHAIITSPGAGTSITWRYLDRIGSPGVTLGTIAGDICDQVGITDYSFITLDQVIDGWSWTQGQASNVIEPLFDLHDSVLRPHDFTVQGIKKTGVAIGSTIPTERLVNEGSRYTVKLRQGSELPLSVTLNFADLEADQQPNTARSSRPLDATGAVGEQSLDLSTLAISADDARGLTDRYHRRVWNERAELTASLTAQHFALEPGDCRTIALDGDEAVWRCKAITVQKNGALHGEWVYDHPSLAIIDNAAGASFDGRDESTIIIPLLSKGFVLDIPLLGDLDESANPPVYIAAGPYAAGSWPGATVYQDVGGEYSSEFGTVASADQATWGYADALPDANPNVWDRGSVIEVVLQTGTLTGTTEAAIDANASLNLALIGSEIVQFTTATLTAPLTYDVSGFKRGRRGTEWATHVARETFLILSEAAAVDIALSDVSTNLSFKAVTSGRTEAGSFPIDLDPFTGAALKPYAPCQMQEVKDPSTGDWVLTWVRRTRVGGAWTGGSAIPLSEASEEYEVEIMNGGTVVRTFTALSSATVTWTAGMQTTDFGSGQATVSWRAYQISDSVGRGFAAAA